VVRRITDACPSVGCGNATFSGGMPVASGTIAAVFGSYLSSGPTYASNVPSADTLAASKYSSTARLRHSSTSTPINAASRFVRPYRRYDDRAAGSGRARGNMISALVDSIAPPAVRPQSTARPPDSSPYGIVINSSDGTLALPSNLGVPAHPAHRGDAITIYALGLGPVSPSVATGTVLPGSEPLARISN